MGVLRRALDVKKQAKVPTLSKDGQFQLDFAALPLYYYAEKRRFSSLMTIRASMAFTMPSPLAST